MWLRLLTIQVERVAKQYAFRLNGTEAILGAAAGREALFVLAKDRLHVIVVNKWQYTPLTRFISMMHSYYIWRY